MLNCYRKDQTVEHVETSTWTIYWKEEMVKIKQSNAGSDLFVYYTVICLFLLMFVVAGFKETYICTDATLIRYIHIPLLNIV